jgi:hypothetical protein
MLAKTVATPLLALSSLVLHVNAISKKQWSKRSDHLYLPKEINDYKTASAPNNVTIRYKNPGICETTPGVDSYAGYVDLAPNVRIIVALFDRPQLTVPRSMYSSGSSNHVVTRHRIHSPCGSTVVLVVTR